MVKDLTVGKPRNVIISFTLPMLISVIFQQMYNMADSIIAGRFAGEDALSAVGASYPVTMIFMAVAFGSNIGCSVVISQLFGAKKIGKVKTAIFTSLIASAVISSVLAVVGVAATTPIMRLINTPENIFSDAELYFRIYILGFVFLFVYNICTAIFQALGDSKTPLWFLIGSSVANVILDYIFVAIFGWGVAGVAWATFIAQGVACVLAFAALFRRTRALKSNEPSELFSWWMFTKIGRIAIPSILQQSFVSVGNMFIQQIINGYGSSVIAGYSSAIKLNTFAVTIFVTFGNGMSSFTAQNYGARKPDRVRRGLLTGGVLSLSAAAICFAALFFASRPMIMLFMDGAASDTAINSGISFLRIVTPFYFSVALKLCCDGVLRGTGKMTLFMISTFTDLILRVVLCYVLPSFYGLYGVWYSWPVGWVAGMAVAMMFCCIMLRKKNDDRLVFGI
ncbi:MAG: MATE family efflux transporter [Firmicutes bacterium]|nr:MATE family efflux transporter [Bacillota bacterium]